MRFENEERWIRRLEQSLDLLAKRLESPPSLQELAEAAGSSPYHFHRIWRAMTGETVSQTAARLRVAKAQQQLSAPGESITSVAMEAGFGSSQSFARAFRRVAGVSPSEFVAGDIGALGVDASPQAEVRIEMRSACKIVAYRRTGGAYRELNSLFQRVWDWASAADLLGRLEGIYGIPYDDPASVDEARLRYAAGVAFGPDVEPETPLLSIELPKGEFAILRHVGDYDALEPVDQALIRWVVASGRAPADFPLIHHFLDEPETTERYALRADAMLLLQPEGTP